MFMLTRHLLHLVLLDIFFFLVLMYLGKMLASMVFPVTLLDNLIDLANVFSTLLFVNRYSAITISDFL